MKISEKRQKVISKKNAIYGIVPFPFIVVAFLFLSSVPKILAAEPVPRQEDHVYMDIDEPGPDIPEKGRSLFEEIFDNGRGGVDIPFPFEKLTQSIAQINADETANGGENRKGGEILSHNVLGVLVPIGRSLQRPRLGLDGKLLFNPFEFPRVLIGFDGKAPGQLAQAFKTVRLDRKLFIGFHEKKKQIEVISYNEAAGRMEFQVVRDYVEGGRPELMYVARPVCISCHKSQGPIFPFAPWAETQNDLLVRHALFKSIDQEAYHGVNLTKKSSAMVNEFDRQIDQANLLLRIQKVWKFICHSASDSERVRLRARALKALVMKSLGVAVNRSLLACPQKEDDGIRYGYFSERVTQKRVFPESHSLQIVEEALSTPALLIELVDGVNERLFGEEASEESQRLNPKLKKASLTIKNSLGVLVHRLEKLFDQFRGVIPHYRMDEKELIPTSNKRNSIEYILSRSLKKNVAFSGSITRKKSRKMKAANAVVEIQLDTSNIEKVEFIDEPVKCFDKNQALVCEGQKGLHIVLADDFLATREKDYKSTFKSYGEFVCHRKRIDETIDSVGGLSFACGKVDNQKLFSDIDRLAEIPSSSLNGVFSDRELLYLFAKMNGLVDTTSREEDSRNLQLPWEKNTTIAKVFGRSELEAEVEAEMIELQSDEQNASHFNKEVFTPFLKNCAHCHTTGEIGPGFLAAESEKELAQNIIANWRKIRHRVWGERDMPLDNPELPTEERNYFANPEVFEKLKRIIGDEKRVKD